MLQCRKAKPIENRTPSKANDELRWGKLSYRTGFNWFLGPSVARFVVPYFTSSCGKLLTQSPGEVGRYLFDHGKVTLFGKKAAHATATRLHQVPMVKCERRLSILSMAK